MCQALGLDAHALHLSRFRRVRAAAVCAVVLGLLAGFICTTSISWVALCAAGLLALAEAYLKPRADAASHVLGHIDGSLLLMVGGFFVVVTGACATNLPGGLYKLIGDLAPDGSVSGLTALDFDSPLDVVLYALVVLLLSQLFSNVPTVLFLSNELAKLKLAPDRADLAWTILAFASTAAGNLTLIGSVANLITAQKAARHPDAEIRLELGFCAHLCFAGPTTLCITIGGSLLLYWIASL